MFASEKNGWKNGNGEKKREKRIGGMRSERERTERRYIEAMREWQEPRASSELSSTAPLVPLLRSGTTAAFGEG